jgi:hypothetical protein
LKDKKKLKPETIVASKSFENIKKGDKFDIFLSYSYPDKDYALIIFALLIECGFSVYIDIKDDSLNRDSVNKKTATRLATIMDKCRSLIYVHTRSAKASKWCPWELGYMSGKSNFRCAVMPLVEEKEKYPYQEYLNLYPYVDYEKDRETGKDTFWANRLNSDRYVDLKEFINGKNPYKHK